MARLLPLASLFCTACIGPPFLTADLAFDGAPDAADEQTLATDASAAFEDAPVDAGHGEAALHGEASSDACAPVTRLVDAALEQCAKLGSVPTPGFYPLLGDAGCTWASTPAECFCTYGCACVLTAKPCSGGRATCDDTGGLPIVVCKGN